MLSQEQGRCGRYVALMLICATLTGCAFSHRVQMTETGSVEYRHVQIDYKLLKSQERSIVLSDNDNRLVAEAADDRTSDLSGEWTIDKLAIRFPAEEGDSENARAILTVFRDESDVDESETRKARISYNFPKQQLDLLLVDLAHSGFFEEQTRPDGGVALNVDIDWGHNAKSWTREPRLDDLADRVYRRGTVEPIQQTERVAGWWNIFAGKP